MKAIVDPEKFRRPSLNLIIAEDHPQWAERLKDLATIIRSWSLCKTEQFNFDCQVCVTVESFKRAVRICLDGGELVYATLDLEMPMYDSEVEEAEKSGRRPMAYENAGEVMVDWCLELQRADHDVRQRLEFCLISGHKHLLEELEKSDLDPDLKEQEVKRINKILLDKDSPGELRINDLAGDIKNLVHRHLSFCTYPNPQAQHVDETVVVWFGGQDRLLGLVDQISGEEKPGVYLIFSDAAGYEIDWVHLCCHLRGVELTDFDAGRPPDLDWDHLFEDPPVALLVRNIDKARQSGCDIARFLTEDRFFRKCEENNSIAFFQFPFFETQLSVSRKLEEKIEEPILQSCLKHVYHQDPPFSPGVSFAFKQDAKIITFGSYAGLREMRAIRNAISFQFLECKRQIDDPELVIDRELFDVLSEIPWYEEGGFEGLRHCIKRAFQNFARDPERTHTLTARSFPRLVTKKFDGELGYVVRGKRLFHTLESRGADVEGEESENARQALANLENLGDLYSDLIGFFDLSDRLSAPFHRTEFLELRTQESNALGKAKDFLDRLFGSPDALREQIDEFRHHVDSPLWRDYYPTLETEGWAAVENINFSWPFTQLHLPASLHDYLRLNKVNPTIHREIGTYLQLYPDLEARWLEAERERRRVSKEIYRKVVYGDQAKKYAAEAHTQPVLRNLAHYGEEVVFPPFSRILRSLVVFDCSLAICENHFGFADRVFKDGQYLRRFLGQAEPDACMDYLKIYLETLRRRSDRDQSIFHRWVEDWNSGSRRGDAFQMVVQLARLAGSKEYRLPVRDRETLSKIGEDRTPAFVQIISFVKILLERNVDAESSSFERDHCEKLTEMLRRILATTTERYRLGTITDQGASLELWGFGDNVEVLESGKWENLHPPEREGRLLLFKEEGRDEESRYVAHFPIDDLIRIRQGKGSLWAYGTSGKWMNLTFFEDSDEESELEVKSQNWLPDTTGDQFSRSRRVTHDFG